MNDTTFEQAMLELEEVVKKLESGTINLDESITLYQRGLELYGYCYQKLQEAEKLVVKINGEKTGE